MGKSKDNNPSDTYYLIPPTFRPSALRLEPYAIFACNSKHATRNPRLATCNAQLATRNSNL